MRCPFLRPTCLVACLGLLALAGCDWGKPERLPLTGATPARNLLLISIDTLRADHLSSYGYGRPTSPRLDAYAARGALFETAISSSSWTVPAHASIFTGLEPSVHGANGFPDPYALPDERRTLAEILQDAGLQTAAFTGGGYMSARTGLGQGFTAFRSKGRRFEVNLPDARTWLDSHADEPFFLFLHAYNTHRPYEPPHPYDQLFAAGYQGDFLLKRDFRPELPRLAQAELDYVVSQYDGEIRNVDDRIADLLDELQAKGRLADTLVVITSDHGDEFYEHGHIDHGHSVYDELVRVPMILFGPRVPPGRYSTPVGTVDLAPTILDLLGIDADRSGFQGRSLAQAITATSEPTARPVFSTTRISFYPFQVDAVRDGRWKLLGWRIGEPTEGSATLNRSHRSKLRTEPTGNFVELFDLANDPGEQADVAATNPEQRDSLHALLRQLGGTAKAAAAPKANLAPHEIEALRALGYVE